MRFLDDVVDVNDYPAVPWRARRETRKVGLGVMGLAELLAGLGVAYDCEQAVRLGARIAVSTRVGDLRPWPPGGSPRQTHGVRSVPTIKPRGGSRIPPNLVDYEAERAAILVGGRAP